MTNLVNHKEYFIADLKEWPDHTLSIALEPVGGPHTTSQAFLDAPEPYQKVSNKYWDRDELMDAIIEYLANVKGAHCHG